jgi:hypothetical protein
MAYSNNIPQASDRLSSSQTSILANFQEIDTYTQVDHVAFNDADQGKHKKSLYIQQAADPVTGATEGAIYAKAGTGGATNLFYRPPAAGTAIEFTYALKANPGYTWLPSGMLIQFGTGTIPGGSAGVVVNFPIVFPTNCLSCTVSPTQGAVGNANGILGLVPNASAIAAATVSVSRMDTGQTGTALIFRYIAIGY